MKVRVELARQGGSIWMAPEGRYRRPIIIANGRNRRILPITGFA
jgi:hypothetical protein